MLKKTATSLLLLLLLAIVSAPAADKSDSEAARAILAQNKDALVFVTAVNKITLGNETHDEKVEVTAMTIDPSGLSICSLAAIDPTANLSGEDDSKIKSSLSDVKIMRADNTEYPARLVLKDPDLDLAFVQPEKPGDMKPLFPFVKIDKSPAPKILDTVVTLDRFGKELGREPMIFTSRISSILTKPRTYYFTSDQGVSVSSPAFLLNGDFLGFRLMKMFPGGESAGLMPVIIPAEDIRQSAKQIKK